MFIELVWVLYHLDKCSAYKYIQIETAKIISIHYYPAIINIDVWVHLTRTYSLYFLLNGFTLDAKIKHYIPCLLQF